MSAPAIEHREPDITLVGLSVWVHGRQFPDLNDFWDANWLDVTARVESQGARVVVRGAFLRNTEIRDFTAALRQLHATLTGVAELKCLEPTLALSLEMTSLGHLDIRVALTPDQLSQSHTFHFGSDQSYLPALIGDCDLILTNYPVRGSP